MTLNTKIYVHSQADLRQLFARCNQLIGANEATLSREYAGGFTNEPGQNLPAWLTVTPGREHGVSAVVSFDTGYGYEDEHGGCSELHVMLIRRLGAWLNDRGLRWSWANEFTGEIYPGLYGLNTLTDTRARPVADRYGLLSVRG